MKPWPWPFVSGDATLAEAIAFISQLTASEGERSNAGKRRVRDHVRKAAGRKKKPRFDAPRDTSARVGQPFWAWASGEWPALKAIEGFPHAPINRAIVSSGFGPFSSSATVTEIPNNVPDLQRAYSDALTTAQQLRVTNGTLSSENASLKTSLQRVESDLEAIRQRDAATKKIRSEAGKRGKGVTHRR